MATFTKNHLSGSTDGKGIIVSASAIASGVTVHTGSTTTTHFHEVWIYASNNHTADIELTIGFGGTTDANDLIISTIPFKSGLFLVVPGLVLQGNASALIVRAAAATINEITLFGYVNEIT